MDLQFTDEQQMFADTVKDLLSRRPSIEERAGSVSAANSFDSQLWRGFAEMGLLGLTVDEDHGGLGAGPVEVSAVMREIGRALAREPLVDGALLPARLIAATGTPEQRSELLPPITEGERMFAVAHLEPGGDWASAATTKAEPAEHGFVLTGVKSPVLRGDLADTVLVSATVTADDSVGLFVVDARAAGIERQDYTTYDGLGGTQLTLTQVPATRLGTADATTAIAEAVVAGQLAVCAEAVGAMEHALALTVDYLKNRKQFGVPLGSFQALAHRAADMYVAVQLASALTSYAAARYAAGDTDPLLAARAKFQVGRAARLIGQEAIQMHGGIGMTAEHAVGHYVTRLLAIEHTFGSTDDQLRLLTARVREYDLVEL